MQFDKNLLFFGNSPYQSVSDYTSLAGFTATSPGWSSPAINLGVAEDMGIGDGEAVPKLALYVGAGITSSSAGFLLNVQFRGSTDSTHWTVYAESGPLSTASFVAGAKIFPIDVPHRPAGAALPQYYDINIAATGTNGSDTISAGSLFGGIVIQRTDNPVGLYRSGFSVI